MKRLYLIFLSVIVLCPLAGAQGKKDEPKKEKLPVLAAAEADSDSVTIGDKVKYTLKVKTAKSTEIEFPSFAENLAGFAIKDFGTAERTFFGKKTITNWYLLDTYTSGKYTIPKAVIKYKEKDSDEWQEIETNEVKIEVKSVLKETPGASDILDIKGPVGFPRKVKPYVVSAVILLFIAIIAAIIAALIKKKKIHETITPPKPAYQMAYEALENLKKKDLIKQGKTKEYYIELSLIVRHYLENRFYLRAPEMTTEEFMSIASDSSSLSYEHKSLLREFLSHCDLVKFAKYKPEYTKIDSSFDSAKKLIDQTKKEAGTEEEETSP